MFLVFVVLVPPLLPTSLLKELFSVTSALSY